MNKSWPNAHTTAPALVIIVCAAGGLFALEGFAVSTARGQRADNSAMTTVSAGAQTLHQLHSYLGIISIGTTAVVLAVCVILALLRGRVFVAVGAIVLVAGANVSTQFLKKAYFDRPNFGHETINSYPSGHTTVAVASVLAALLVTPALLRPAVIVLGSFAATLVGTSTVVGGWHRPSDVIGALAVCLIWGALVALAVGALHHPQTDGLVRSCVLALIGAAAAGAFLIAVGVRPTNGVAGFVDATAILASLGVATGLSIGVYARLVPR